MEFGDVRRVLEALALEGVDYVLVGGVAVNLHGLVRATEDLDLFVRPTAENVDRVRRALGRVWSDPAIQEIRAEDLGGDYPTVRYGPPEGDLMIDLLSRLGTEVRFDDLEVEIVDLDGVSVRLATPRTLIRMKRGTIRPIDHEDARRLAFAFGLEAELEEG